MSDISLPSQALEGSLSAAALKYKLPLTLLEALAFDASRFDPNFKRGEGAEAKQGLFGFTDLQLEAYGVVDPFDVLQAIEGACLALRDIVKHLPDMSMILAAWYLGNVVKVAHLNGTTPASWPRDVREFCQRLLAIRYWFQDQATPVGADAKEKLSNAIRALADANPGLNPRINAARDALVEYNESLLPDPLLDGLKIVWLAYRDAFDIAPITNAATPLPERLEPDWWRETSTALTPTLQSMQQWISNVARAVVQETGERIDQLMVGGFILAAGLGALYIALNRRSAR